MKGDARPRKYKARSGVVARRKTDQLPTFQEFRDLRANFAAWQTANGMARRPFQRSLQARTGRA